MGPCVRPSRQGNRGWGVKAASFDGARVRPLTEQQVQRVFVDYLKRVCAVKFWAVPNGGYRTKAEASILIGQGVEAGVADLHFLLPGGKLGVIEMKSAGGRLSENQKAWLAAVKEGGAETAVCYSFEEAQAQIRLWGIDRSFRA
jgi:hypothetical protein